MDLQAITTCPGRWEREDKVSMDLGWLWTLTTMGSNGLGCPCLFLDGQHMGYEEGLILERTLPRRQSSVPFPRPQVSQMTTGNMVTRWSGTRAGPRAWFPTVLDLDCGPSALSHGWVSQTAPFSAQILKDFCLHFYTHTHTQATCMHTLVCALSTGSYRSIRFPWSWSH